VVHDDSGRGERLRGVMVDITERKQAELELARVIRALKMLSRCNDALIRADSEERLLDEICRIAVEIGAYRMAWVGYALDDEAKTIAPKTHAGAEDGYLEQVRFTWAEDDPLGRGPAGRAIRSGEPVILPDLAAEESFSPWLEAAHARGFRGVVCLPLKDQDRTFGVLVLYQSEVCALQPDELRLLQELADDLAFGVVNLRARARERRTHEAVLAMARGVSASTGTEFFEKLTFAMVEALGAHAGFIAELKPPDQTTARTLCAVVANQIAPNFDYTLAGTPCEHVDQADVWVVPRDARRRYPQSRSLAEMGIEAYVGTKLLDPSGQPIGLMFVLFQEPLEQWEFISSTLKIFASRAAAELERLRADAKVREQAALLDQTRDAILLTDLEDRILFWNKGAERTYGWTAAEAIGKSCIELLHLDREQYRQAREYLQAHGYWTGELKKKTKAGTELTIECRWTLTGGQGNASKSILAIDTDITERKRAEAR
ncbi:MAG: diguanylate cyclase, partial [Azospira oryzae]